VVLLVAHEVVKEDIGITYPRSGSSSSGPKAAGLEWNMRGGERSTTETELSAPHTQPHNQPPSWEVAENLRRKLNGCAWT
jgi:hypothetical protein